MGSKTIDVCKLGDTLILAEVEKVYKGKKDEEGNALKKGGLCSKAKRTAAEAAAAGSACFADMIVGQHFVAAASAV